MNGSGTGRLTLPQLRKSAVFYSYVIPVDLPPTGEKVGRSPCRSTPITWHRTTSMFACSTRWHFPLYQSANWIGSANCWVLEITGRRRVGGLVAREQRDQQSGIGPEQTEEVHKKNRNGVDGVGTCGIRSVAAPQSARCPHSQVRAGPMESWRCYCQRYRLLQPGGNYDWRNQAVHNSRLVRPRSRR